MHLHQLPLPLWPFPFPGHAPQDGLSPKLLAVTSLSQGRFLEIQRHFQTPGLGTPGRQGSNFNNLSFPLPWKWMAARMKTIFTSPASKNPGAPESCDSVPARQTSLESGGWSEGGGSGKEIKLFPSNILNGESSHEEFRALSPGSFHVGGFHCSL